MPPTVSRSVNEGGALVSERVAYRLIQPPGWVHLVIDDQVDAAISALAHELVRESPLEQRVQIEGLLRNQLRTSVEKAREIGGQDVYLPTKQVGGIPLAMSIVVASSPPKSSSSTSTPNDALLAFAARNDSAQAKTVDGQLAVRKVIDVAAELDDNGQLLQPASRRITYLIVTPGEVSRMMVLTGSILNLDVVDGDELVEAMEFLFDSIVTTVRFERSEAVT